MQGDPALVGKRFPLAFEAMIGRSPQAEIPLVNDGKSSRLHAKVVFVDGRYWVFDLGSTNATFVNDQPIERHALANGDVLQVGRVRLRFELE